MFLTQIYGTILGGFVNYAVMISIVNSNRALLVDGNGNSSWSGATMQSYNTNAASWALAGYLYKAGATYSMVTVGLAIGSGAVVLHRIIYWVSTHLILPGRTINHTRTSADLPPPRTARPQGQGRLPQRDQSPAVHPVRRLHPLQCQPDVRHLQLGHRRLLHPVLPPQLPPAHLPRLHVPRHGRLGRRKPDGSFHPVLRRLRSRRTLHTHAFVVGQQRQW